MPLEKEEAVGKTVGTPLGVAPGERAFDRAGSSGVGSGLVGLGAAAAPFARGTACDCFFLLLKGTGNLSNADFGFSFLDTAFTRLSSSESSLSPGVDATPFVKGTTSAPCSFRFLLLPARRPCKRTASRVIVLPDA